MSDLVNNDQTLHSNIHFTYSVQNSQSSTIVTDILYDKINQRFISAATASGSTFEVKVNMSWYTNIYDSTMLLRVAGGLEGKFTARNLSYGTTMFGSCRQTQVLMATHPLSDVRSGRGT